MRIAALVSVAVLASAGAAHAQEVSVAIGPQLQEQAEDLGQRELDFLARDLQSSVESRLARAGMTERVELTIVDARPNRPTFAQLGHRPGLSRQSFGIGGAKIEGAVVHADGTLTPLSYQWYENDIRWAEHSTTWADAESAFDKFANRLASGRLYAAR
jgi:hypothetical protein